MASPDRPVEYMIYQYPGVSLLIQIDAVGTEFEAKVYGPERALIKYSRLPARRVGPVFQLIEPTNTARQLIVEITPAYATDRSQIKIELQQLREEERTDAIQAEAFRQMSRAVDTVSANDSTTWAGKIYTFKRAAQVFESLGWEELRLWCEYYAAHLVYFKLDDALSAIEMARTVQVAAERAGFQTIEMAAMQLLGTTLVNSSELRSGVSLEEKYEEIHRVLIQTARLADQLGFQSEQSLALFNDGIAWEQQENLEQALVQYRLALDISASAGDTELANRIRNQAAFAYESRGSVEGAIEMLDQVGDELSDENAVLKLVESLYEKGRILNESFRFREAGETLSKAHDLLKTAGYSSRMAQTGLALGRALFGMGLMEPAANMLSESIRKAPASESVSQLADALGMLARIQRYRGDWNAMTAARDEQASLIDGSNAKAQLTYQRALDLLASSGGQSREAARLLARSRALAESSGDPVLAAGALLQTCAHTPPSRGTGSGCSESRVNQAYESLRQLATPRQTLEARLARVKFWHRNRNTEKAMAGMKRILDEMRFYQEVVPGVLGGWYWGVRQDVFNAYLSMALQRSGAGTGSFTDGRQVLLVVEELRRIASADSRRGSQNQGPDTSILAAEIRGGMSAYVNAVSSLEQANAVRDIDRAVQQGIRDFIAESPGLDNRGLADLMSGFPADSTFLTYCFTDEAVYAIVADRTGVQLRKLLHDGDILSNLVDIADRLGHPGTGDLFGNDLQTRLESLGGLMLGQIQSLVKSNIYLMPLGLLRGFPFELLRLDGHYLAENHNVTQLMTLSGLSDMSVQVSTSAIDLFFLAGDPELKRDVFSYEQRRSAEVSAITDLFVGPSLHIIQGPALKIDEFYDERFARADIIHLSIPGLINLESPQESSMTLSKSGESEFANLRPQNIPGAMNASLAVLSLTRFERQIVPGFGNYLGFVSDFLGSGVDSVVSSLWPLEDESRAVFMDAFYRNLADEPDVAKALFRTKRAFFEPQRATSPGLWSAFQLYIN